MTEFASHFVDTNGIRTHYFEAGSGPTLVLMHGGDAGADAYGTGETAFRFSPAGFE
ncbi:MAG: hypothetical protein SXG53_00680 [Pseudomonadota bacterium]|nr:hypothetical protein [Pseudomonadota bacterium]